MRSGVRVSQGVQYKYYECSFSSVGRAQLSQSWGRGSESRKLLFILLLGPVAQLYRASVS